MTRELFESDHYAWLQFGIEQTKSLGLTEVSEYLDEMSKSELRALESHLANLIMHLLKWKYQPEKQTRSWKISIFNSRRQIELSLKTSPSLKPKMYSIAQGEYKRAVNGAEIETGIKRKNFPQQLEFTQDELMDFDFYPNDTLDT